MNIFDFETKKKHIEQFENNVSEMLINDFPEFKKVLKISKLYGINFTTKPEGIHLTKGYKPKDFEELKKNYNIHFNLNGVYVFNNNLKTYIPIKLNYLNNALTNIEIDNPKKFHKNFNINNLKIEKLSIEKLSIENPEKEIVLKILEKVDAEKLNLLDLDNTFEIELNGKLYYTILDMEDGNYIAIDIQGKFYSLSHDRRIISKIISKNPIEFFELYSGVKNDLVKIMD